VFFSVLATLINKILTYTGIRSGSPFE
jgi:hypothetical protein